MELKPKGLQENWVPHAVSIGLLWVLLLAILWPLYPLHRIHTHIHHGDALITCYLVNWGQSVLWSRPWDYFNIPLFKLGPGLNAFTETNPLMEFLTGPMRLFGNPVLSYNVLMLLNALFSGASAYVLGYWISKRHDAAILGGLVFAVNPWMQWHLWGHPNISAPFAMPLAILFYGKFREDERTIWSVLCSGAVLLQFLASIYLGVILAICMVTIWIVDLASGGLRKIKLKQESTFVLSAFVVLAAVFFLTSPYIDFSERAGSTRGLDQAILFSSSPWGYLLPPRWEGGPRTALATALENLPMEQRLEDVAFVGYGVIVLSIVGVFCFIRNRREHGGGELRAQTRLIKLVGIAAAIAFILSLGPLLWVGNRPSGIRLPFWFIYEFVSPLRFLRATSRFGIIVILFFSIATVAGWACLSQHQRWKRWMIVLPVALILVEYFPVSAPPLMAPSQVGRSALQALEADEVVAPFPFGDDSWLPNAAGKFPKTPSGSDGGVYLYPYQRLKHWINTGDVENQIRKLRVIGVDYLYVDDEDAVQLLRSVMGVVVTISWNGGGLFEIEKLDSETRNPPSFVWRPTFESDPALDAVEPWEPVRVIVPNWKGEWEEYEGSLAEDGIVYEDLNDAFGLVVGGESMREFGRLVLRVRHNKTGIDFEPARIRWITEQNPDLAKAPFVETMISGSNDWQTVDFDLSSHSSFQADDSLLALFLTVPVGTYPGLKLEIAEMWIDRSMEVP